MIPAPTGPMPALPAITAKILVLVERVLDCFVTVSMEPANACCNIANFYGTTTPCGEQLAVSLAGLIGALSNLGAYMFGALGVVVS